MGRRHVGLVFRRELLDLRRERRVFRSLFMQPLVFLLVLAAPAFLFQRAEARNRGETLTVAVQGDVDAVPGLRAALERPPFKIRETHDAGRALSDESAEVGVEIPADAGALVDAGQPVPLRALSFSTQDVSSRAVPALTRRLAELRRAESGRLLAASGAPASLAAPVRLEIVDVATTSAEGIRFGIAQAIPALVLIQLFSLVTLASSRLVGAKERRTLESLLVLPIERRDLLVGIGAAAIVVGAVSAVLILVPVTLLLSTAVASVSRSLGGPIDVVVSIAAGTLGVAVVLVAAGLYTGARAGSGSENSALSTMVQLSIFGAVMSAPFLAEVDVATQVLAAPLIGPMLFVRNGIAEGPALADAATMLLAQVLIALVVIRAAARLLDTDRGVLRATK